MGKLIQQKQEAGELLKKSEKKSNFYKNKSVVESNDNTKLTLSEIGITRDESSTSKKLAAIPEDKFEQKGKWVNLFSRSRKRGNWRKKAITNLQWW